MTARTAAADAAFDLAVVLAEEVVRNALPVSSARWDFMAEALAVAISDGVVRRPTPFDIAEENL